MSEVFKLCGAAFIALASVLVLRSANSNLAEITASFFGVCIMARVLMNVASLTEYLNTLADGTEVKGHLKTLLKAAGIAYLTEFTSGICRDAGVGTVASYVEMLGKTELIMLSLPLMSELLELSFAFLKL